MRNAIPGLSLDVSRLTAGFIVVGADRHACPRHFGVFLDVADANAYRDESNAAAAAAGASNRYAVKAWRKSRRRAA